MHGNDMSNAAARRHDAIEARSTGHVDAKNPRVAAPTYYNDNPTSDDDSRSSSPSWASEDSFEDEVDILPLEEMVLEAACVATFGHAHPTDVLARHAKSIASLMLTLQLEIDALEREREEELNKRVAEALSILRRQERQRENSRRQEWLNDSDIEAILAQGRVFRNQASAVIAVAMTLPDRYKLKTAWSLVYSTFIHGRSMPTFLRRTTDASANAPWLILVETIAGDRFGGFVTGTWTTQAFQRVDAISWSMNRMAPIFGTGESYLFKLDLRRVDERDRAGERASARTEDAKFQRILDQQARDVNATGADIEATKYGWTRKNSLFHHASVRQGLWMGASGSVGDEDEFPDYNTASGYGFFVDQGFVSGHSSHSDTYDNPCLTVPADFEVAALELWSIK